VRARAFGGNQPATTSATAALTAVNYSLRETFAYTLRKSAQLLRVLSCAPRPRSVATLKAQGRGILRRCKNGRYSIHD
jgi:hypothetical protein